MICLECRNGRHHACLSPKASDYQPPGCFCQHKVITPDSVKRASTGQPGAFTGPSSDDTG